MCTSSLPLKVDGYVPLVGSDKHGWGWDINRSVVLHDRKVLAKYPRTAVSCPDVFYLILDMDEGILAFKTKDRHLGVAFTNLAGQNLHVAVSAVWGNCEVKLRYIGGYTGM